MATANNLLLDGDGPPKVDDLETNYKDSPWTNLPAPVFNKLCSKLNAAFIHAARQVCATWLANVENLVGLKVKVDDSIEGNLEFVHSVKVVQARIVNWKRYVYNQPQNDSSVLFQFPTCLKKMTLCGEMPAEWRLRHLMEFTNLSHLVIRGKGMHGNDVTGSPFPQPTAWLTAEETNLLYGQHNPSIQADPIILQRLKKLEVIMNEFSYPSVLPLTVRLNEPDRAMEHERNLQHLYFVVLNNISFILNNLKSPVLLAVQFYIYPKAGTVPPSKINWKNMPLQRFMQNHRNTLEQIYLPEFEGKQENSEIGDISQFPIKLTKLQLHLTRYIGDREEAREQNMGYWQKFLQEQTQLQDIHLQFADISSGWLDDALTSLSFSSKDTLRYIDITVQSEESVSLNLEMFSLCHCLQVLKLSGRDNEILLRNINKLPASLKKLYISMSFVEPPQDPNFLAKYVNLEMVVVKTILVAEQQQTHVRTLNMIRNICKLRKLNLLLLTFDAPLNSNRDLVSMLSNLDDDIDSPYPIFTVKFNLVYEFEVGWNEDTFDEDTLNIEFINMREPEDYSTWHNRHRNAISVDDEDHRIFIFQTLPYLLDLRHGHAHGRIRGAVGLHGEDAGNISDDDDDDDDTDSDDSTIAVVSDGTNDHSQDI